MKNALKNKVKLSSAEISFLIHATEDADRVLQAVSQSLALPPDVFEQKRLEGHFGNPILLCRARLIRSEADRFIENLFSRMNMEDKRLLIKELDMHMNEQGSLHLRIDKQQVVSGRVELSRYDAVKIKLKLKFRYRPKDLVSQFEALIS